MASSKEIKKAAPAPKFKQPPVLFDKTQAMIQKIQNRLGGKVITYWNGSRGSVCHSDVTALFKLLEHIGTQKSSSYSSSQMVATDVRRSAW